jgi:hypothetical protein
MHGNVLGVSWIVVPVGVRVNVPTGFGAGLGGVISPPVVVVVVVVVDPWPQPPQVAWAGPARPKAPALIIPPITAEQAMVLKFATRVVMLTLPLDLTCHELTRDLSS